MAEYEKRQIESLLQTESAGGIDFGVGLFLAPDHPDFAQIHTAAVLPAMRKNALNRVWPVRVFGSDASLREVVRWLKAAEVIVADVSTVNADPMCVLGLAHGLKRCPILIMHEGTDPPFDLFALRCIEYRPDVKGVADLRARVARAIRVVLTANKNPGA